MEGNSPDTSENLTEVIERMFNHLQNVKFEDMDELEKEEIYDVLTQGLQESGAIKPDNSIDLNSFLGFNVMNIRILPADSPVAHFLKKYGSCFPIKGDTPKESVKLLVNRMNEKITPNQPDQNDNKEAANN
ncbi:uncharacterized protein LOC123262996 [Cotesia glomerata]|uniref:Uncharacterized protein n=1 Tax=Cotesia glomerata TaxID=32391 RepID=A0AAV7IUP7_COTGL|nr:uncharacterized protein LOC123262996 [Cotesia glomerata]KAH0568338.1 hypothetical protein KQX54_020474 [Cotesia glomerata]